MEATVETWQNAYTAANGLGAVDVATWERSIAFMSGLPDYPGREAGHRGRLRRHDLRGAVTRGAVAPAGGARIAWRGRAVAPHRRGAGRPSG